MSSRVRKFKDYNNSIVIGTVNNMQTYFVSCDIGLLFDIVILSNNGDCCSTLRSFSIFYFEACASDSQFLGYILSLLRKQLS